MQMTDFEFNLFGRPEIMIPDKAKTVIHCDLGRFCAFSSDFINEEEINFERFLCRIFNGELKNILQDSDKKGHCVGAVVFGVDFALQVRTSLLLRF